ncbi:MAG TPA: tRNA pseudouridine synthase A [Phycisphaerales bacterium]|nr:tRNA pseudouridine synthase A [Phycisphaerales bacterium]
MPRYKLTIAYDGTDFCGWQKQEPFADALHANPQARPHQAGATHATLEDRIRRGTAGELKLEVQGSVHREGEDRPRVQLRTVQHVVERAVREIVREPVILMGSSRTDAGVHAKGQVAAFSCSGDDDAGTEPLGAKSRVDDDTPPTSPRHSGWPLSRGTDRLLYALNGRLPPDALITSIEPVASHFDPIGDTRAKGYSYTIHASRTRPLWDRRYVAHVWETLDHARMHEAAKHLTGEHDFAAFAAAGHGRLTTVRTIYDCTVTRAAEDRIRIDVSGNGFLYNMVRIIAGTLADVGRGRLTPDDIPRIIASKDRRQAGSTMPPEGLCLEWIRY